MTTPTQTFSRWALEVLKPGEHSSIPTQCASIRLRNTSATTTLYIAPRNSSYKLPIPPGGVWGIDLTDVRDELETIIEVYTATHDADVIVERIFKRGS